MSDLICTHRELINWYEEQEQLPLKVNDSTRDVNGSEYAHGYKITRVSSLQCLFKQCFILDLYNN